MNITANAGAFSGIDRATATEGWKFEAPKIEHQGKTIKLPADPADMPIPIAIEHLQRLQKEEETASAPFEFIKCFPFDGAVAFQRALKHLFGWASAEMVPTMFGPSPPTPISVRIGHNAEDFVVVPMGEFSIPALPNQHRIGIVFARDEAGGFGVKIYAKTTRKYENVVRTIAFTTQEFLKAESIYKGKAFRLFVEDGNIDLNRQPEFIDAQKINPTDLHLNRDVRQAVETSIFTPIRHSDTCRLLGIPLKRGVLLEGPYGVGKSLISSITAREAVDHGWTFLTIDAPSALQDTLLLAQQYQPCVVFCEDIDRAVTLDRDDEANGILNVVDGILSKSKDVMVVFTTNHVEKISKAMLRPGRLDAVISIRPPDLETIQCLIRYYGAGTVDPMAPLVDVAKALVDQIPATIREVVERSKLHTIPRIVNGEMPLILAEDLLTTALTMTRHLELLNAPEEEEADAEFVLRRMGEIMLGGANTTRDAIDHLGQNLAARTSGIMKEVFEAKKCISQTTAGVGKVKEDTEKILENVE